MKNQFYRSCRWLWTKLKQFHHESKLKAGYSLVEVEQPKNSPHEIVAVRLPGSLIVLKRDIKSLLADDALLDNLEGRVVKFLSALYYSRESSTLFSIKSINYLNKKWEVELVSQRTGEYIKINPLNIQQNFDIIERLNSHEAYRLGFIYAQAELNHLFNGVSQE